jgi:hypothetical protein
VNVRLLIAGIASLLLLCWIAFVPGTLPALIAGPGYAPSGGRILVSVALSVTAAVPLLPVLFRGSRAQRVAAGLALVFPAATLVWAISGGLR